MTVAELGLKVSKYEESSNIYMNFKIEDNEVWGLPEGSRSQHYINSERVEKYKLFLLDAINHYTNMATFDSDYTKKRDKYKKYLKRLETAINKIY